MASIVQQSDHLVAVAKERIPTLVPRNRDAPKRRPSPGPPTPDLLPPPVKVQYQKPIRRILTATDHRLFLESPTYRLIDAFVFSLADSVHGHTVTEVKSAPTNPVVKSLLDILDKAERLTLDHPPDETGGSRFGNKAFRGWCEALAVRGPSWHDPILTSRGSQATEEVSTYLQNAFGSKVRLDYGSGHELNFVIWLLCFYQLNLVPRSAFPALTLLVFPRYLALTRHLQTMYYLEPAGSHGLWGLDDYAFLPFLFGASQLVDHPYLRPLGIHSSAQVEENAADYLYFNQIQFVNATKTVQGLRWHSPMLDDISSAKSWFKIEAGMKKIFLAEILGRSVVMQHFLFGGLVPAEPSMSRETDFDIKSQKIEEEGGEVQVFTDGQGVKHIHNESSWGGCCGIKVPSSAGAMGEMRKQRKEPPLRSIPLD